jgi:hypothetical protein
MAAPPVVGEDRIRGVRRFAVVVHPDFDTVAAQLGNVAIELLQGLELHVFADGGRLLETVVRRRVLIEGETCRANHQNGIGGLHGHRFNEG